MREDKTFGVHVVGGASLHQPLSRADEGHLLLTRGFAQRSNSGHTALTVHVETRRPAGVRFVGRKDEEQDWREHEAEAYSKALLGVSASFSP